MLGDAPHTFPQRTLQIPPRSFSSHSYCHTFTCYYSNFLSNVVPVLRCHQEVIDAISCLEMDLDTYLTSNVLDIFTETLDIKYHHVDVFVVLVGIVGASVNLPGTRVGLCIAVLLVFPCFKSFEDPCGVCAPRKSHTYEFLFLM